MAALCPGVQYGLSSQGNFGENKDLIFVKLTDSAYRAIEEYFRNQALLSKFIEDNIRDRTVKLHSIPNLLTVAGFDDDTVTQIVAVSSTLDIDVGTILKDPVSHWKFDENNTRKYVNMRAILRKIDIAKRTETINTSAIEELKEWDQICQLFEEQIKSKDFVQCERWYSYFEDEAINGTYLLGLKKEADRKKFMEKLDLKLGQIDTFKELLKQIQAKERKSNINSLTATNANVGVMSVAGCKIKTGNINIGNTKPKCNN